MKIVPHKCPVCQTEHVRAFPACSKDCQAVWRKRRHGETWKRRVTYYQEGGLCGWCGAKAVEGKKKCRVHLKADVDRQKKHRAKKLAEKRKEEAAMRLACAQVALRKANQQTNEQRMDAGLLPSREPRARMPKDWVQIEDV